MIAIEKTSQGYRVVEFTPSGFLVLATYADHANAVRAANRFKAEIQRENP